MQQINFLHNKAKGFSLTREEFIIKTTYELHQIALNIDNDTNLIKSLAKLCSYALILDFDTSNIQIDFGNRQGIVELILHSLYESLNNEPFKKENNLFNVCYNALNYLGADSFKEIEKVLDSGI